MKIVLHRKTENGSVSRVLIETNDSVFISFEDKDGEIFDVSSFSSDSNEIINIFENYPYQKYTELKEQSWNYKRK